MSSVNNNCNHKIIYLLLYVFVLICVFFPSDRYNIKIFTFIIIMLMSYKLFNYKKRRDNIIIIWGAIFPLTLMIISSIKTGDIYDAVSMAYVPCLFLLIIPIIEYNINFNEIVLKFLKIESIIIVLLALFDILNIYDMNGNNYIRNFIYYWDIGFIGKSAEYSTYFKIFFKTSPAILLLLYESVKRKEYFYVCVSCIALILSGTRANIIITLLYLIFRLVIFAYKKNKKNIMVSISILVVLAFTYFCKMMGKTTAILSDNIKRRQLIGLFQAIFNPKNILFGQGFGSLYFDYGRNEYESVAELAYFNLLRQVGLIMFVLFLLFILYPLFTNIDIQLKIIYFGYLLIAFTNPLLFSSTAYLVYIFVYLNVFKAKYFIQYYH